LKNNFFNNVQGYSIQVKWANVQAIGDKFSQDSTHTKSLKLFHF